MIKTLLVDDQMLIRQGISSLLGFSETIEVVGEVTNGSEVLPFLQTNLVDVILLDLQMPVMDGVQVMQLLKEKSMGVNCLILTTFEDDIRLISCLNLGAKGYLLKDTSFDQLVDAIEKVNAGEQILPTTVTQNLLKALKTQVFYDKVENAPNKLTNREKEVLNFMAGGYSNKEISLAIHLSEGTVKNHVSNILSKLGVRDRTRAVLKGIELGLIE